MTDGQEISQQDQLIFRDRRLQSAERHRQQFYKYVVENTGSNENHDAIEEKLSNIIVANNFARSTNRWEHCIITGQLLSYYFSVRSRWDEGVDYYEIALEAAIELNNIENRMFFEKEFASLMLNKGEYSKAEEMLRRIIEYPSELDKHKTTALLNLANIEDLRGNLLEAVEFTSKALKIASDNNHSIDLVKCLTMVGSLHIKVGELQTAETHLDQALKLARSSRDFLQAAIVCEMLASIYLRTSQFDMAHEYAEMALQIYKEYKDVKNISFVEYVIGSIYFHEGMYDQSEDHFLVSIKNAESIEDMKLRADSRYMLATIYKTRGQYTEAEEIFQDCLQVFMKQRDQIAVNQNIYDIATIYVDTGRYEQARKLFLELIRKHME